MSGQEEEQTQRENTVNTTSLLVSRTDGSSFIQFVDESQQNHTQNSISDKGLASDCTDIDDESSLGERETKRWTRSNSDSGPVFLYIQMELCRKSTLKDWLADNHSRDYHYVMNIFQQIVSAVEYVHTQGMMHRDLKVIIVIPLFLAFQSFSLPVHPPVCPAIFNTAATH